MPRKDFWMALPPVGAGLRYRCWKLRPQNQSRHQAQWAGTGRGGGRRRSDGQRELRSVSMSPIRQSFRHCRVMELAMFSQLSCNPSGALGSCIHRLTRYTGVAENLTGTEFRTRKYATVLKGVFLLLDELKKQDGVLGPTAVVRYLSELRSVVDARPHWLFLMLGITPDALRRYSVAFPALRGRLQNQSRWSPLPM